MSRLHKLCQDPGRSLIKRKTTHRSRSQICWYPSSGDDFRHISFLENEWFTGSEKPTPLIYLHTDVWLPDRKNLREKPRDLVPFESGEQLGKDLFVDSVTEVTLKDPVRHHAGQIVYSAEPNDHTGRAFFVELRFEARHKGMAVWVPVPLFYVIAENLAFLVRVLLHQRFHIHTLVHIRDGGRSMGNSRIPMNFIYQVSDKLRLKRVISDQSPESRRGFAQECREALEHEEKEWGRECCFIRERDGWDRAAAQRYRMNDRRNYGRHWGMDKQDERIRKMMLERWRASPIDLYRFPANWASPPGGHYHDWRAVPRTHAYQDGKVISPQVQDGD